VLNKIKTLKCFVITKKKKDNIHTQILKNAQNIVVLVGCSEWGVKILSSQGNITFKMGLKLGPYNNSSL